MIEWFKAHPEIKDEYKETEGDPKVKAKIRQLRASGTTLLFASHSAELLRMLCYNALWLERGRIVKQGPVAEVIDAYQSAPRQG